MTMKKYFLAIIAVMLLTMPAMAQAKKGKTLEVSFNYLKQAGPGSNQYAVWIENEKGEVVSVRGNEQPMRGYLKRPNCVPTWVKTVKAESLSDQQLDAVTGATPKANGKQTFSWDFTDQQGKKVKDGKYCVKVEATLYQASSIVYTGSFSSKDKAGNVALTSKLSEPNETHKDMITDVKAVIK